MSKTIRLVYYAVVVGILLVAMYKIFTTGTEVELGINQGLVLTASAFALWILFSLRHMVHNVKKSMLALIGAAAVGVIFFIAFSMAEPVRLDSFPDVSDNMSKVISGGLVTVYVLGGFCILAAVYSEVLGIFKNN